MDRDSRVVVFLTGHTRYLEVRVPSTLPHSCNKLFRLAWCSLLLYESWLGPTLVCHGISSALDLFLHQALHLSCLLIPLPGLGPSNCVGPAVNSAL